MKGLRRAFAFGIILNLIFTQSLGAATAPSTSNKTVTVATNPAVAQTTTTTRPPPRLVLYSYSPHQLTKAERVRHYYDFKNNPDAPLISEKGEIYTGAALDAIIEKEGGQLQSIKLLSIRPTPGKRGWSRVSYQERTPLIYEFESKKIRLDYEIYSPVISLVNLRIESNGLTENYSNMRQGIKFDFRSCALPSSQTSCDSGEPPHGFEKFVGRYIGFPPWEGRIIYKNLVDNSLVEYKTQFDFYIKKKPEPPPRSITILDPEATAKGKDTVTVDISDKVRGAIQGDIVSIDIVDEEDGNRVIKTVDMDLNDLNSTESFKKIFELGDQEHPYKKEFVKYRIHVKWENNGKAQETISRFYKVKVERPIDPVDPTHFVGIIQAWYVDPTKTSVNGFVNLHDVPANAKISLWASGDPNNLGRDSSLIQDTFIPGTPENPNGQHFFNFAFTPEIPIVYLRFSVDGRIYYYTYTVGEVGKAPPKDISSDDPSTFSS